MEQRIHYGKAAPAALKGLLELENYLKSSGLEVNLLHMIKLRASQINGCAYCIDMHWKDARAAGESEQRLYGLDAWEESPYYSDRERAALRWTESTTNITQGHVPDEVFVDVREFFSEKEIVDLTLASAAINAWNRIAIAMRATPGKYQASHS